MNLKKVLKVMQFKWKSNSFDKIMRYKSFTFIVFRFCVLFFILCLVVIDPPIRVICVIRGQPFFIAHYRQVATKFYCPGMTRINTIALRVVLRYVWWRLRHPSV